MPPPDSWHTFKLVGFLLSYTAKNYNFDLNKQNWKLNPEASKIQRSFEYNFITFSKVAAQL